MDSTTIFLIVIGVVAIVLIVTLIRRGASTTHSVHSEVTSRFGDPEPADPMRPRRSSTASSGDSRRRPDSAGVMPVAAPIGGSDSGSSGGAPSGGADGGGAAGGGC